MIKYSGLYGLNVFPMYLRTGNNLTYEIVFGALHSRIKSLGSKFTLFLLSSFLYEVIFPPSNFLCTQFVSSCLIFFFHPPSKIFFFFLWFLPTIKTDNIAESPVNIIFTISNTPTIFFLPLHHILICNLQALLISK